MLMLQDAPAPVLDRTESIVLYPVRGAEESFVHMNRTAYDRVGTAEALGCYVETPKKAGKHWPTRLLYEVVWQPCLPGFSAN